MESHHLTNSLDMFVYHFLVFGEFFLVFAELYCHQHRHTAFIWVHTVNYKPRYLHNLWKKIVNSYVIKQFKLNLLELSICHDLLSNNTSPVFFFSFLLDMYIMKDFIVGHCRLNYPWIFKTLFWVWLYSFVGFIGIFIWLKILNTISCRVKKY